MLRLRTILFAWPLLIFGAWQTPAPAGVAPYGPYNGSFIPAGLGLKRALDPNDPLLKPDHPWTIYCWIKSDATPNARTLLAGFGEPAGEAGAQRFLAAHSGRLAFSSGGETITTQTPVASGSWQLVAATFDGSELILYADAVRVAASKPRLAPAAPAAYLAPVPPQSPDAAHFAGKIARFTLLPLALAPEEVRALLGARASLDLTEFEPGSKTWPVQTKGQDGLRAPQEPATLPQSAASAETISQPRTASARAATDNAARLERRGDNEWSLASGWKLIEAPRVSAGGAALSLPGYATGGWLDAVVPGTVLTTLVERGVYPDPDFGLNNLAIPESLNKQDYWYRAEFTPPASARGRRFTLRFAGANYSATVWLNGRRLGEIKGAFARGQFDATDLIVAGRANALAVRVSPPPHPGIPHEQSIKAGPGPNGGAMCLDGPTFICAEGWDWIPGIRDRDTGLWQDVTLKATGPVRIGDAHVVTRLPLPDTSRASVSINVPLRNETRRAVAGTLEVSFEGAAISRRVVVAPGETEVRLRPSEYAQLNVRGPRLWWPNGYGRPELYHLRISFKTAAGESDGASLRFGIREISYELTLLDSTGHTRRVEYRPTVAGGARVVNLGHEGIVETAEGWLPSFAAGGESSPSIRPLEDRRASPFLVVRVNGVRVAVRGGNWGMDDSRKRVTRERLEPYFRLHRDANLTMIRNWCGQSTEEVFFDLADEYGLLVWNDFWLSTQDWNLEPDDPALFLANAREVVERFRNHPSVAIWCGRNEGVPPPILNLGLDALVRELDGTRYYIPNSRSINLQDSGPWSYTADYFKFFTTRGRGFSTELGIPSPPSLDTVRAMLADSDEWPPSDAWAYHDWHFKGGQEVTPMVKAMEDELGAPASLEDFERKAQLMNYAAHRAAFEGFNAHLWEPNTGRLMWMTHPAWPSTEWQMYASDYSTHAAFFGIKKACEPVHVQLNLPGMETAVVNNTTRPLENLRIAARVYSTGGEELSSREEIISARPEATTQGFAVTLPKRADDAVVFVKLTLADDAGHLLSENFYWQAAQHSGYRKLDEMPLATVHGSAVLHYGDETARVHVELVNDGPEVSATLHGGPGVALLTEVTMRGADERTRVLPAYASDNYVSLLPNERREIVIDIPLSAVRPGLSVTISGWNVRPAAVRVVLPHHEGRPAAPPPLP